MKYAVTILLSVFSLAVSAQQDSLEHVLQEVTVQGYTTNKYSLGQDATGSVQVKMDMMFSLPKILGNADPIHYAEMLPGVQTTSEFDSGLHIQGCENGHNYLSLSGVPLYNVEHLLGFFSVFNASHYSILSLSKTTSSAASPNRLGGMLDILMADSLPQRLSGEYAVGPMSSQGTLRIPISSRSALVLSGRWAYLNLLYKPFLEVEDDQMRYGFGDLNATWTYCPDDKNRLWLDAYWGYDKASFVSMDFQSDANVKWSNNLAALHWQYSSGRFNMHHTFYNTAYRNKFEIATGGMMLSLPSHVYDFGYKGNATWRGLNIGFEAMTHHILPQSPEVEGEYIVENSPQPVQRAFETAVFAEYVAHISQQIEATAGLRFSTFHSDGKTFSSFDPNIALQYKPNANHSVRLSAATRRQYLFQTGFSNSGMPTEFWFAATQAHEPQHSVNTSLAYEGLTENLMYKFNAEIYYKRLWNQIEYTGTAYDFAYYSYNLDDMLITGKGYNYGLNVMLEKRKGKVTGWLSYSVGRAWRKFPREESISGKYPASHERIHELNAFATYRLNDKWDFSMTLVAASGTPFTAVKYFYLLNGRLGAEYGEHNANRLNPYFRMDVSANLYLKSKPGRERGINFSLYNTTASPNHMFRSLRVRNNNYAYKPIIFMARVMPSVSYFYKF